MSGTEARSPFAVIKNFGSNLGKNKKKLFIGGGITAIALTVAYNSMLSQSELTLPTAVKESASANLETVGTKSLSGDVAIQFKEDVTGVTQSNARLNKLEEKAYADKVYSAARNTESEIISREGSQAKIRFNSNEGLKRVDKENIVHNINVPEIATNTVITPPKMTFIDEVKATEQAPQSYIVEDNSQAYIAEQEAIINANITAQFAKVIEEQAKNENLSTDNQNYVTTEIYTAEKAKLDKAKEEQQKLADDMREAQRQQLLSQATMPQQGYVPSNTVVKTSQNSAVNQNEVMFQMGEIVSAITLMGASNLNMGPIKVQLTEGKYAGAILNGTVSQTLKRLNFQFSSMYLPNDPTLIPVNAIALKHDTLEVGTYTDIDNRYFLRYVVSPVLKAGAAVGEYYANDANTGTTTTSASGATVQSGVNKNADTARKVAMGEALNAVNEDIDEIDKSVIITQDQYTPIKLYFTQEVVYKPAKEAPSLARTSSNNDYVQPLGSKNSTQFQQAMGSSSYDALMLERNGLNYQQPQPFAPVVSPTVAPTATPATSPANP